MLAAYKGVPTIPPKLPVKQHEAIITAAQRPDQLVAGRDDKPYWRGEPWFNGRTLNGFRQAGHAAPYPQPWHAGLIERGESVGGPLHLTPAGRTYARVRGNVTVNRRKVVIISSGDEKKPIPEGQRHGWPAGELYISKYHRSLRRAADALTHHDLIFILSAFHGLVPLDRDLHPYDVTLNDERAVTEKTMAGHTGAAGLFDPDVIFLGGKDYADLICPSVPHLLAPLSGGMGAPRAVQAGPRGLRRTQHVVEGGSRPPRRARRPLTDCPGVSAPGHPWQPTHQPGAPQHRAPDREDHEFAVRPPHRPHRHV
ncbi:DUF6884 domain-containing protein [Streptomyces cyaneofuscatus]|uniref:DUF6884 domain-containing protein n=1 Tax=Streptomyces cyaneofuscatus TaxID=66883 RepID=UPI003667C0EE